MQTRNFSGGDNHYLAHNYDPYPTDFVRGRGSRLWDRDGNQYLDFMTGYSAVSCGHCHPRIVEALVKQSCTLGMTSRAYRSGMLDRLARELCNLSGFDRMLPMNTGAEAVETAIKAARRWAYERREVPKHLAKIIVAENNFHGRTTTIVGFSSDRDNAIYGPPTGGFLHVRFGDYSHMETIAEINKDNLAAVLLEPIQGEAGIIVPPDGYLASVSALCKRLNVKLILDEVQSGLGRAGEWFAFEHEHEVEPSAILLGKALGGGMLPVSCMLGDADLMDVFTPGSHGSTFGGNQLACAVALETLAVLGDENMISNSETLGNWMLHQLRNRLMGNPLVKDVRGRGLWAGVELTVDAKQICLRLLERGVVSKDTHGTVIRLAPPLNISAADLELGIDTVVEVCCEAAVEHSEGPSNAEVPTTAG